MKNLILYILFSSMSLGIFAQEWKPLSGDAAESTAKSIITAVRDIKTLDRKFTQLKQSPMVTKPAKSTGSMHYETPDKMTWSYDAPNDFSIVMQGDKMTASKGGQVIKMSSKQQMGLKSMMKMIVGMSSGSTLFDDRSFEWSIAEKSDSYKVDMLPKNKNVKRMFSKVELFFDKSNKSIKSIELSESDGSLTTITFKEA